MKRVNSELLKKEFKKINNLLIIGIVCAVLTAVCLGMGAYADKKEPKDAMYLNDVIMDKNNAKDVSAYLNVAYDPYSFAEYDDATNKSFYIISDGDYYYIAYMNDSDYRKMDKSNLKEKPVKIYGKTKTITSDIKKLALETYNEGVEADKKITLSDFNDYFGGVYLDTTEINMSSTIMVLIGVITGMMTWVYLLLFVVRKVQTTNVLKKIDDSELEKIEKELDDKDAFHYEKAHLILTKNYIVSLTGKLLFLKYKDVIMMYEYRLRQYGVTTNKSLMVMDRLGKVKPIVQVDGVTKKSKAIINEVAETIASKNEDMLVGYTSDNLKKAKEIAKKNKEKEKEKELGK
ncbi:MAG: hypothetical protein NC483_04955 [Ruminococcus sp.]|nr:hypothetical protein [Ruminococcus sp.]